MKNLAIVILAAGKSTRMKSEKSKLFHSLAGIPVITHVVREAVRLRPQRIVIVIGKGERTKFESILGKNQRIEYTVQLDALGTGDAVMSAKQKLRNFDGWVLILPGDVPRIKADDIAAFISEAERESVECAFLTTRHPAPASYGRIIRDTDEKFIAIREFKDASSKERAINEINTGIVVARSEWLFKRLKCVRPTNAQKEYYLTDIVELADCAAGEKVAAYCHGLYDKYLGINDRIDLADVNRLVYREIAEEWMRKGVSILEPALTYIDADVKIGEDTAIMPFTFIKGKTVIGKRCVIENGAVISDSRLGNDVHVRPYTVMEKARVAGGAAVGPFSRLRPDAILEAGVKVGNFVEVKKSVLEKGVKANHLSYIGDALIGAGTNVGCGTITCNYDGKKKHKTTVGKNVFIGSDVQFVAPVAIGSGSTIGAGSTITENVPPGTLAIARARQVNIVRSPKSGGLKSGRRKALNRR